MCSGKRTLFKCLCANFQCPRARSHGQYLGAGCGHICALEISHDPYDLCKDFTKQSPQHAVIYRYQMPNCPNFRWEDEVKIITTAMCQPCIIACMPQYTKKPDPSDPN